MESKRDVLSISLFLFNFYSLDRPLLIKENGFGDYLTFMNILLNLIFFRPVASLSSDSQMNLGLPTI